MAGTVDFLAFDFEADFFDLRLVLSVSISWASFTISAAWLSAAGAERCFWVR
jgi:hypothetical protein